MLSVSFAWTVLAAGPAQQADAALAPYFGGQKVSELLKAAREKLAAADAVQETTLSALPGETQSIYQLKGEGLELVEDLNAVARNAFAGNSALLGQFNKDMLLRGRREKPEDPVS